MFAVGVIGGIGALAWIVITIQGLSHDLQTANAARDQLAQQVQQLGGKPVAGPPGSRGEPGPAVVGPSGAPGSPGVAGSPGVPGRTGASASPVPGPSGPAGSPGANSTIPGPAGSPGAVGAQGVPGVAGADGKDGSPGKDGTNGAAGTNGRDGTNGAPPAGWTYTDAAGQSYTCSPVAAFDPTSPRYTCAADTAPPPTPSPSAGAAARSGAVGVGMLAASAMYRRLP
jgi:hypothetical protein